MVASVTLAKVLGILYIVPLTQLIGSAGLGIYQNAYSLYVILLTLATSGFPTAMGKLVSENLALGKNSQVEQIYKVTMRMVIRLGIAAAIVIWFGAPLYSWIVSATDPLHQGSTYLVPSIRALAPSLLVVPIMSALRGYLQGFQRLEPSGYSQAIEQLFRVIAMLVGAYIIWHLDRTSTPKLASHGAAAATFGSFVGAVFGLIWLVIAVVPLRRNFLSRPMTAPSRLSDKEVVRELYKIALPVCTGALVVPISQFMDSVTVQNFLMLSGKYTFTTATAAFGVLSRQAFTLIQLPLAFAMAIGSSVLPAISGANALRDYRTIQTQVRGTIRSMFFITFPTAVTLLVLAKPIDYLLFGTDQGAYIISSVSFMGIFSGLELISTYMLQGLGKMYRPVRNMFVGIAIKLVLNLALILPFGIMGAAIASTIGYLVSSMLNVFAVRKYSNTQFSVIRLMVPSFAASIPLCVSLFFTYGIFGFITPSGLGQRVVSGVEVFGSLAIGGVVYVISAIWVHAVSAEELRRFPVIGSRLARLSLRFHPNR